MGPNRRNKAVLCITDSDFLMYNPLEIVLEWVEND